MRILFLFLLLIITCSKNGTNVHCPEDESIVFDREKDSFYEPREHVYGPEEAPFYTKEPKTSQAKEETSKKSTSLIPQAGENPDPRESLISQIKKGAIGYSVPTRMIEGKEYTAYLRIDDLISNELTDGLDNPIVKNVQVSATMRATLSSDSNIIIDTSLSSSVQLRKLGKPTEWRWSIKPIKSGKYNINLKIVCILKRRGYTDETYDLKTYENKLIVLVDPWYRFKNILKSYWNILIGMLISSSAVGWLLKRLFSKKKPL